MKEIKDINDFIVCEDISGWSPLITNTRSESSK